MSTTRERPLDAGTPVRSSRWAWLAFVLSPFAAVLAVWMSFFVLGDENISWWGELVVIALTLGPPVAAVSLGIRSSRTGNPMGRLAAAAGAAWLTFVLAFSLGANTAWVGESNVAPLTLAAILALAVGSAIEVSWNRSRRGHHLA